MENWDQYKDIAGMFSMTCFRDAPVSITEPASPVIKGDGIHHAGFGRLLEEKCKAVN